MTTRIYACGGYNGSAVESSVDALSFAIDTANYVAKGAMNRLRWLQGSVVNQAAGVGYNSGGTDQTSYWSDMDAVFCAIDTATAVAKGTLVAGTYILSSAASLISGYLCGGNPSGGGYVSTTQSFAFSADTTATVAKGAINNSLGASGGAVANKINIYICGGVNGSQYFQTVDALAFAVDTANYVSKGLLTERRGNVAGSVNLPNNVAYIMGGFSDISGYRADTDGFFMSVDTSNGLTKAALVTGNYYCGGGASSIGCFAMGGNPNGGGYVATTQEMYFAIDTTATVAKGNLSVARACSGAGFSL